jgi:hypothetical protein
MFTIPEQLVTVLRKKNPLAWEMELLPIFLDSIPDSPSAAYWSQP